MEEEHAMTSSAPWEAEYRVFGIPRTFIPYTDQPVHSMLYEAAEKYPHMGLVCDGRRLSYPEVREQSEKLAQAFLDLGLAAGERVATMLPTSIQFVVVDYALSMAGLVHVPLSFLDSVELIAGKLSMASSSALVCISDYIDKAHNAVALAGKMHIICTQPGDYSGEPGSRMRVTSPEGVFWLMDLIEKSEPLHTRSVPDVTRDMETLLFTGGTTGVAKGCMLTHRNVYANALQNSYAVGRLEQTVKGAASVLLGIPFFHSYGHVIMHSMTLLGFNQILIQDPRDTEGMVNAIRKYRPIVQIGVPTQFMKLAGEKLGGDFNMIAISGSAALPPQLVREFEEQCGGNIMEGYGLSEMTAVTHLNTSVLTRLLGGRGVYYFLNKLLGIPGIIYIMNRIARARGSEKTGGFFGKLNRIMRKSLAARKILRSAEKRGSIGIPSPDTEVRLLDVESGNVVSWEEAKNGRTGEMCLSGPQRMLGYWPEPGSGLDADGFVRTGDVVRMDKRGYFYVVDRVKDMINVSGYKVYSREIDDLLYAHPAVETGAAVGVPDPDRPGSERVVIYVKFKPDMKPADGEGEIREYLSSRVARYALPKVVRIVEEIPLTAMQKVDKKMLREQAKREFM